MKVAQLSYTDARGVLDFGDADVLQMLTGWAGIAHPINKTNMFVFYSLMIFISKGLGCRSFRASRHDGERP